MSEKRVEFHGFLVEDGTVIGHYRAVHTDNNMLDKKPSLWIADEPPKRAVALMGGSFVLNSALIEDAEIMDNLEDIPGVLIPRPGEDGWQLEPVTGVPDWKLMPLKEDSGQ